MLLYLLLNVGAVSIPLAFSFHKRMRFIQYWPSVLSSLTIVACVFLIWDAWFTKYQVWGFNSDYHLPFLLLGMPLEEWLFFFCIPYASIFIHYALIYYFPHLILSERLTHILSIGGIVMALGIALLNTDKMYTCVNYLLLFVILSIGLLRGIKHLQRFYIAFLMILVPFFFVNGVLTGLGLEKPVVWYNHEEHLGIRLLTIPIEDTGYAFSMLFANILLIEYFKTKRIGAS